MKEPHGPLSGCVAAALERYFHDLDGQDAANLYDLVLAEVERPLLEAVMRQVQSNQCRAAKILGINRNTLRKKLQRYALSENPNSGPRNPKKKRSR